MTSTSYLLSVAWKTGARVRRVDMAAAHPDRAIVSRLEQAGLRVESVGSAEVCVRGKAQRGIDGDATVYPDLIPTLAALACVLPGPSTFRGVKILRGKESDRLGGVQKLVAAVGGKTTLEREDVLTVHPPTTPARTFQMSSQEDHRMAMASATLAVLLGAELELSEPLCVSKSFPSFWDELRQIGVTTTPR